MKKVLLGTTAIVGAAFLSGEALAADPIQLDVGGYSAWGFGGVIAGDDNDFNNTGHKNTMLNTSTEINFTGSTELDNGITVGARLELEFSPSNGNTTSLRHDETYIFFSGGFGEVQIGMQDDAAEGMSTQGPCASMFCSDDNTFVMLTNSATTGSYFGDTTVASEEVIELSGDANKIVYMTPRFAGFRAGVSYAPGSGEGQGDGTGIATAATNGGAQDTWSGGANYRGSIGPVDLGAGFVTTTQNRTAGEDRFGWHTGANVGFAGFSVGGGVGKFEGTADTTAWNASANYSFGPATVGVGYFSEVTAVLDAQAGQTAGGLRGEYDRDMFSIDGSYALGPGISTHAGVQYHDIEADNIAAGRDADYNGVGIGIGFNVGF